MRGCDSNLRNAVLIPFRALGCGCRVPLAPAHARDLHALEQSGLAEGLVAGKLLRLFPARYVDDETAPRARDAVVGEQRAAEHQKVRVPVEIGQMLFSVGSADPGRALVAVFLIDDVKHALPLRSAISLALNLRQSHAQG